MNLPTEVRYRPYADWTNEEKTKIKENVGKSPWRASYHIAVSYTHLDVYKRQSMVRPVNWSTIRISCSGLTT